MSKIFISHASENNAEALAIELWLKSEGWNEYFLDLHPDRGINTGERWQEALRKSTDRCDAVIILLSDEWIKKPWCLAELNLAQLLKKTIFALIIDEIPSSSIPNGIRAEWQTCDLTKGKSKVKFNVELDGRLPNTDVFFTETGLSKLKEGLRKASISPDYFEWPPKHEPDRRPYRGLEALTEEDAAIYFGRDSAIISGIDKLRELRERSVERLMVVIGASGSGKSSFLKAGLWPRLKRDDRHYFPLPIIRPEKNVIEGRSGFVNALSSSLKELSIKHNRADITKTINDPNGLTSILNQIRHKISERFEPSDLPVSILLGIDQAEELLNGEGQENSFHFLSLINEIIQADNGKSPPLLIVVFTIRSDSYKQLQDIEQLRGLPQALFNLAPVSTSEYKEIISGPVKLINKVGNSLEIEPSLVDKLLDDAKGPDALPLLAYTLQRLLINYGDDNKLELKEYEDFGGMTGSIEAALSDACKDSGLNLSPLNAKESLINIFIPSLASIDPQSNEPRRNIASYKEMAERFSGLVPLIKQLIEKRLLTQDNDSLEITHESILRQWVLIQDALGKEKDNLRLFEGIKRASNDWNINKKEIGIYISRDVWLDHKGERLNKAETLMKSPMYSSELNKSPFVEYLKACRISEEQYIKLRKEDASAKEKAQRIARRILIALAFIVFVSSIFVLNQRNEALKLANNVMIQDALDAFKKQDDLTALKLAIGAVRTQVFSSLDDNLRVKALSIFLQTPARLILDHDKESVLKAIYSPNGEYILTTASDNKSKIWDSHTGNLLKTIKQDGDKISSSEFCLNGLGVLTTAPDGSSTLWDLKNTTKPQHKSDGKLVLSQDGQYVVIAPILNFSTLFVDHIDQKVIIQSTKTGQSYKLTHNSIYAPLFSHNGQFIVTRPKFDDRTLLIADSKSGHELYKLTHDNKINDVTFSKNDKYIITSSADNSAIIWDTYTGNEVQRLSHPEAVKHANPSPDEEYILTSCSDDKVRLWLIGDDEAQNVIENQDGFFNSTFSPDGNSFITISKDVATIWTATVGNPIHILKHEDAISSASFSPDGKNVLITGNGNATVWNGLSSGKLKEFDQGVSHSFASFISSGKSIISSSGTKVKIFDYQSGKRSLQFKHEKRVNKLALSNTEELIAVASDNKVTVWDIKSPDNKHEITQEDEVKDISFIINTNYIVIATNQVVSIYDIKNRQTISEFRQHSEDISDIEIRHAAFSKKGEKFAVLLGEKVVIFATKTGQILYEFKQQARVDRIVLSNDGEQVAIASNNKTVTIWDTKVGNPIQEFKSESIVKGIAISNNKKFIATFSGNKVSIWDKKSGFKLNELAHQDSVRSIEFDKEDQKLVSVAGSKIIIWDLQYLYLPADKLITKSCYEKLAHSKIVTQNERQKSLTFSARYNEGDDICKPLAWYENIWQSVEHYF